MLSTPNPRPAASPIPKIHTASLTCFGLLQHRRRLLLVVVGVLALVALGAAVAAEGSQFARHALSPVPTALIYRVMIDKACRIIAKDDPGALEADGRLTGMCRKRDFIRGENGVEAPAAVKHHGPGQPKRRCFREAQRKGALGWGVRVLGFYFGEDRIGMSSSVSFMKYVEICDGPF